jgi:hypothetical protein
MGPIAGAVAAIERQPLRAIGIFTGGNGPVDYPISWEDAARDTGWVEKRLRAAGISQGDFVAVVSTGHEAPWYQAVLDAVYMIGATVCPLEPARFEIGRAEMFFRRFPISSIIGLDRDLATALDDAMGLAELLAKLRFILVRPDAVAMACAANAVFGVIAPIGPALGIADNVSAPFEIDGAEWRLEERQGQVCIFANGQRAYAAVGQSLPSEIRFVTAASALLALSEVGL